MRAGWGGEQGQILKSLMGLVPSSLKSLKIKENLLEGFEQDSGTMKFAFFNYCSGYMLVRRWRG